VISGRVFSFASLVIVTLLILRSIFNAQRGKPVSVRPISALDALPEAVGRSVEMGKPVLYNVGIADIVGTTAAQTMAGLVVLSHVADLCARYDSQILVPIRQPNVLPLAEETVRTSYSNHGKIENYNPDWIQYLSSEQWAFVGGVMGMIQRERPGANIMIGGFWSEALILVEGGNSIGAIQIGGTGNLPQVPFFVAACDYTLIGEEIYAAGAAASQNPVSLGSVEGQDLGKTLAVLLILAGSLLATFGSDFLINLTKQ
jgi:hypothetical protein